MKKIIMDLDNTIAGPMTNAYADCTPNQAVIQRMREYRRLGFSIAIFTARNMRTHNGNIGLINAKTLPVITDWLKCHDVPYDEIWVGKPWCGTEGFYVDDRTLRPDEFVALQPEEVQQFLNGSISGNEDGPGRD